MAYENLKSCLSGIGASADLSAKQYFIVVIDSNGQCAVCGDGANASGVLQNKPGAAGRACHISGPGSVTKVEAGGTIAMGANVASDANGNAVTAASGDYILGICVDGGDSGELVSVWQTHPGRVA